MDARRLFGALLPMTTLMLAGCTAAATPEMIGDYPHDPIATYVAPPPGSVVVYDVYLDIAVGDVDAAAEQAASIAYDNGGYLASSQTWYEGSRQHTTVVLAVP